VFEAAPILPDCRSATFLHPLGVAGFAAAADYSYFATDGFTSCADDFVSAIVGFAAMAKYFIAASSSAIRRGDCRSVFRFPSSKSAST
jgi:hypothetical protein